MSNDPKKKVSGKVLFGCDYLHLMRYMEIPEPSQSKNEFSQVTDAVMRFFLLQWGFRLNEIDEANNIFWEKLNSNTLDQDINMPINRILAVTKDEKESREKLLMEIVAIANMDGNVSEEEGKLARYFRDKFDFRPSEFDELVERGIDWSNAFNYLGSVYVKSGLKLD